MRRQTDEVGSRAERSQGAEPPGRKSPAETTVTRGGQQNTAGWAEMHAPGFSTSLADCSITHRLKDARTDAGKEAAQPKVTFVAKGGGSSEQLQVSPVDFQLIQAEIQKAKTITITRRPACPAHEAPTDLKESRNKCATFLITVIHMTLMMVFVLFPPWPSRVCRKLLFRAPPRGQSYHLLYGEGKESRTTFFAREALGHSNIRLCLPPLLTKKVDAIDVFYHALRSSVQILTVEKNVHICSVYLSCDLTRLHFPQGGNSPILIIFCQPNSSDLGSCLLMEPNFADIADFLWCDLLFFDYPGYGVSDGQPSEYLVYRSAEVVMEYAKSLGYVEENIILMGFSLGTAAATHLAANAPKLGALVLLAPFTSLLRVFFNCPQMELSFFFDRFRSIDKASAVSCPTLVCHGTKDCIIKLAHGEAMAAEIQGSEVFVVDKASHQSLLCQRAMWDRVQLFLNKKLRVKARWRQHLKTVSTLSHTSSPASITAPSNTAVSGKPSTEKI